MLRFAWHLTTLAWWGIGAILMALSLVPLQGVHQATLIIIAVTFVLTGMIILLASCGRHLAWLVFFAIAGLSVFPLY